MNVLWLKYPGICFSLKELQIWNILPPEGFRCLLLRGFMTANVTPKKVSKILLIMLSIK